MSNILSHNSGGTHSISTLRVGTLTVLQGVVFRFGFPLDIILRASQYLLEEVIKFMKLVVKNVMDISISLTDGFHFGKSNN